MQSALDFLTFKTAEVSYTTMLYGGSNEDFIFLVLTKSNGKIYSSVSFMSIYQ